MYSVVYLMYSVVYLMYSVAFDRIKTIQMQPISLFKYQGKCSVTILHLCMHVQTGCDISDGV